MGSFHGILHIITYFRASAIFGIFSLIEVILWLGLLGLSGYSLKLTRDYV